MASGQVLICKNQSPLLQTVSRAWQAAPCFLPGFSLMTRSSPGIMPVLMVNETFNFNSLKETLDITDGNLASHLKGLEEKEMIKVIKQFIGRKSNTSYSATKTGIAEFRQHLKALENLIKEQHFFCIYAL